MLIELTQYGFDVRVDRFGRTPVRLYFEEVPSIRYTGRTKYICCVETGIYTKHGSGVKYEPVGSYNIHDFYNDGVDKRKKDKLRRALGGRLYSELIRTTRGIIDGDVNINGKTLVTV